MLAVTALYGLAAVAESRKDFDAAKAAYERIVSLCADGAFAAHATIARERIDSLSALANEVKLYRFADLAPIDEPPPPATPPVPFDDALKQGEGSVLAPEGAPQTPDPAAPEPAPAAPTEPAPEQPEEPGDSTPEKPGEPK